MQNRGVISRRDDQISSSPDWASPLAISKESPFAAHLRHEKETSPRHENGKSENVHDIPLAEELELEDEGTCSNY